jgi:hypothetical protein
MIRERPNSAADHESGALPRLRIRRTCANAMRLSPQMQYDRVFPVAMPGELHIPPFCAPQRTDVEIPAAVHNGGSVRGVEIEH